MVEMELSIRRGNVIKGMAMLAVMVIHGLAFFPGIYTTHTMAWVFVFLDQLARFCVPAFLFLSGIGLMKKYGNEELVWWQFVKGRITKLLPLYLYWSGFSMAVFWWIPEWRYGNQPDSIMVQLLFGQADYQLYFVPILVQLYLLFPLLVRWRKKLGWLVFGAMGLQLMGVWWFGTSVGTSERLEYGLFVSWIFYFVFGIWLAVNNSIMYYRRWLPWGVILSFGLVVGMAINRIRIGVDPLLALKFTRPEVMGYASAMLLFLSTIKPAYIQKQWEKVGFWLEMLGRESYLVFLAHVMGFRIFYAVLTHQVDYWQTGIVLAGWLWLVIFSKKVSR